MRIVGIDPGTKSSPLVITSILAESKDDLTIEDQLLIPPLQWNLKHQINLISDCVNDFLLGYPPDLISLEYSVYMGDANVNFLKCLGSIENKISSDLYYKMLYVYPTSVKKTMGGGKLEKDQVAEALKTVFVGRKDKNFIQKLIDQKLWDCTDSIAIAYTGYIKNLEMSQ